MIDHSMKHDIYKLCIGSRFIGHNVKMEIYDHTIHFFGDQIDIKIDINKISGIQQIYIPYEDTSKLVLEIDDNSYVDKADIGVLYRIKYPSFHYITIVSNHSSLISINDKICSYSPLKYKLKKGLPNWSQKIPFLTPKLRRTLQIAIVTIEICLCIWTIYQLIYNSPSLKHVVYYVAYKCSPFINMISYILTPFISLWNTIGEYLKVVFQLKILSNLQYQFLLDLFSFITIIVSPIIYLIGSVFSVIYKIISFILNLIIPYQRLFGVVDKAKESIPISKRIYKILTYFWEYIIKPIKHVYILIVAPRSGELGRTMKTLGDLKDNENDDSKKTK